MVFMVYTMEGDFRFSWCTPWKGILQFRGVNTREAKNGFGGVHHGRGFWIFMVYTMEGIFEISFEFLKIRI